MYNFHALKITDVWSPSRTKEKSQDKRKTTWYCNVNTIRSSLKGNGNGVVMKNGGGSVRGESEAEEW
ncbi:hypothetical protein DEO72_LG1g3146 [Vigna unguiculata]|uniref:Uncharacterized protein n=1 Tax=Vigna unguiculata TaxID=3917 RepID=A0A4D6KZE8_VIGUN|nr:hypothetical protein DEO72_LG1g3146 [Vigna unguiculata]